MSLRNRRITHSFNSLSFLFRNANSLGPGRQRCVLVGILTEQLQELVRVLANQLRELWIPGAYLLQDWLEHARLCLNYLTQLLELWIGSKKIKITEPAGASFATSTSARSRSRSKTFPEET